MSHCNPLSDSDCLFSKFVLEINKRKTCRVQSEMPMMTGMKDSSEVQGYDMMFSKGMFSHSHQN